MTRFLIFVLPFALQFPALTINFDAENKDLVNVTVNGEDDILQQCIDGGLRMSYRYELQICKRRAAWFDNCQDLRTVIHSLEFDPITENYVVRMDQHGDKEDPKVVTTKSSKDARASLANIKKLELSYLSEGDEKYVKSARSYISARVTTECQGDHNETLADISYFLSLGLIRISGSNSGWTDFNLSSRKKS